MIFEVYEAFRSAGTPEEEAKKVAEALSSEQVATKSDIAGLKVDMADLRSDMRLIKWMLALVIITTVVPALKSLFT